MAALLPSLLQVHSKGIQEAGTFGVRRPLREGIGVDVLAHGLAVQAQGLGDLAGRDPFLMQGDHGIVPFETTGPTTLTVLLQAQETAGIGRRRVSRLWYGRARDTLRGRGLEREVATDSP